MESARGPRSWIRQREHYGCVLLSRKDQQEVSGSLLHLLLASVSVSPTFLSFFFPASHLRPIRLSHFALQIFAEPSGKFSDSVIDWASARPFETLPGLGSVHGTHRFRLLLRLAVRLNGQLFSANKLSFPHHLTLHLLSRHARVLREKLYALTRTSTLLLVRTRFVVHVQRMAFLRALCLRQCYRRSLPVMQRRAAVTSLWRSALRLALPLRRKILPHCAHTAALRQSHLSPSLSRQFS